MQKIGREVAFLKTGAGNPRNGEGSFIRLKDGRIMFAHTHYYGEAWTDHAIARIEAIYSSDEGESWSESSVLLEKDSDALNIMSVSLIRLENGDLGMLYVRKSLINNDVICMPYFVRSTDEGKTFGEPISVIDEPGYYVVNNDRLQRLKSGRLLVPVACHGNSGNRLLPGKITVYYSDDDARTFKRSESTVASPYCDHARLQEPGVYELPDGRVWMYCRTAYGHQYQCFSTDGGESFCEITPAFRFTSPDAPMLLKSAHGYTLAVFNPIGYNCLRDDLEHWKSPKRTPYVIAISDDGGMSFVGTDCVSNNGGFAPFVERCRLLEDDRTNSYCYPAVIETADGILIAYYHSNGTPVCLNATKIIKVSLDELKK
jgi:hypothetical protein